MERPTHDWIALDRCGCVCMIMWDTGEAEMFRTLARWRKGGYPVERVPVAEAVQRLNTPCTHQDAQLTLFEAPDAPR